MFASSFCGVNKASWQLCNSIDEYLAFSSTQHERAYITLPVEHALV